jgi:hypothetical protein
MDYVFFADGLIEVRVEVTNSAALIVGQRAGDKYLASADRLRPIKLCP